MQNRFVRKIKGDTQERVSVILLAAGQSRRVYRAGSRAVWVCPHTNQPIIASQIKLIRDRFPHSDIVVVLGYDFDAVYKVVEPLNVRVVENPHFENTGPIASLRLGLLALHNSPTVVFHTDIIFTEKLLKDVQTNRSNIIGDSHGLFNKSEIGLQECRGNVISMRYDWPVKWANVAVFTDKELSMLRKYCLNADNARNNVFEAVNEIIDAGGIFKATSTTDKVYEIDSHSDYNKLRGQKR